MSARRLGIGTWRAFVMERGGTEPVGELNWQSLGCARVLDGTSAGSVTIGVEGLRNSKCCSVLSVAAAWRHELALWRVSDPTDEVEGVVPDWVGPLVTPAFGRADVVVAARDLTEWWERRKLEHNRSFTGTDLATIFEQYHDDAMERDPSPAIDLVPTGPAGVSGDRSVLATDHRYAGDQLRELARSGVDYTAVGRTVYIGGADLVADELPLLVADHVDDPRYTPRGLATGTEVTVVGGRRQGSDAPYVGVAGGVDSELGLVQVVHSEPTLLDDTSCADAASSRWDLLRSNPGFVTATLRPEAAVRFADLVPGARWPVGLELACTELDETLRLADVRVSSTVGGDGTVSETISVTLEPLGTED